MSEESKGRTTGSWPTRVTTPMSADAGAAEAYVAKACMTRGKKHPGRVTTLGGGIFLGICLHVCPRQGPSLLYIRGARVPVEGVG